MVQPSSIRESYVSAVRDWLTTVERAIRTEGIDYLRLSTADRIEPALRRFLVGRKAASP